MRRSRFSATALAIAGVLALGASSALAGGPPLINVTDHAVDLPTTFVDVHPCTGEPIEVSSVESGVMHFLLRADGTISATGTVRGDFSGDLLPVDGTPDATGHYTVVFVSNGAIDETGSTFGNADTAFILNGVIENPDGSTTSFHVMSVAVFDADGNPKITFDRAHCS
jgi:hypothetical protein